MRTGRRWPKTPLPSIRPLGNLHPTLLLLPFPCGVERMFECVLTWEAPGGVPPVCFG